MASTVIAPVQVSALGQLVKIDKGDGGQGILYRASGVKLDGASAVYKQYRPSVLGTINVAQLRQMIAFLFSLSATDGAWLIKHAAWPVREVQNGNVTTGFLMPEVPPSFRVSLRLPSGRMQDTIGQVQHLLNDRSWLAARGLAITDKQRFEFLIEVARVLSFLHQHQIYVGDFSAKNLLFSLSPVVTCHFIDCDAMRLHGGSVSPQFETPGWAVPSAWNQPLATQASDAYKFGLLVVRLLAGDQTTTSPAALLGKLPAIETLCRQALSSTPSARPAADQWLLALQQTAAQVTSKRLVTRLPPPVRQSQPPSPHQPASISRRLGACAIDVLALFVSGFLLLLLSVHIAFMIAGGTYDSSTYHSVSNVEVMLVLFVYPAIYYAYFQSGGRPGTPGERLLNVHVVRNSGGRLSFFRLIVRFYCMYLLIWFILPAFIPLFSRSRRALHDLVTDTVIVRK